VYCPSRRHQSRNEVSSIRLQHVLPIVSPSEPLRTVGCLRQQQQNRTYYPGNPSALSAKRPHDKATKLLVELSVLMICVMRLSLCVRYRMWGCFRCNAKRIVEFLKKKRPPCGVSEICHRRSVRLIPGSFTVFIYGDRWTDFH